MLRFSAGNKNKTFNPSKKKISSDPPDFFFFFFFYGDCNTTIFVFCPKVGMLSSLRSSLKHTSIIMFVLTSRSAFSLFSLRGYCTSGPYFWRLCAFSQKIKQLWTKYPMDLVRNVPRNSKITVLLQWRPLLWSYSENCTKINIFHVLSHKSIITWVSEIRVL